MNFSLNFFAKKQTKSSDLLPVISQKEQLINFERRIKAILLNNDRNPNDVIKSLLNENNAGPSRFQQKMILDKPTSFLICIYYIKLHLSTNANLRQIKLNISDLQDWLHGITEEQISIPKEFINKIKYKDEVITIHSSTFKTAPIDLSNHIGTSYFPSDPKFTAKLLKHKIGEIYHNADGICDGVVTYFLESFAKILQQPKIIRNKEKVELLKKLRSKNSSLISRDTYHTISYYHHFKPRIYSLSQIKKVNISNHNLLQGIISIADVMTSQKINATFTKCRTYEHVTGLIVVKYEDWFKYTYHEPNDPNGWCSMYFHKTELHPCNDRLNSFISHMAYFETRKEYDIQVSLVISTHSTFAEQSVNLDLAMPTNEFEQQQLLLIAIDIRDENMIKEIIQQFPLGLNFHYKGLTPLIMLIQMRLHGAVKLFLENGADANLRSLPRIGIVMNLDEFKRNNNLSLAIISSKVVYKTESGLVYLSINDFYRKIKFSADGVINLNTIRELQTHIDTIEMQEIFPLLISGASPLDVAGQLVADRNKMWNLILQYR